MTRHPIRILLVQGSPDHRRLTRRGLKPELSPELFPEGFSSYELHEAADVPSGLAVLAAHPCDVILYDLESGAAPGAGLEGLAELRAEDPGLPLIAIGSATEEERVARALRGGAWDFVPRTGLQSPAADVLPRAIRYALERHRLQRELEHTHQLGLHAAHHDALTGLPNRELFRSRLRQLLAQVRRAPRQFAVLFLDLDRFKQINDSLGHGTGDRVLQAVAERLQACIRASDTAARRGGDEFTLILDDIRRGQDAARVAKKILTRLEAPIEVDGQELFVGASIGISLYPADGAEVDMLVKHADIAMYRAKARGGGGSQFYLPDMNDRALERMEMENSLHAALERGEFVLHYQPQVDLASGEVASMEALVRWRHPDLGLVYPDEFIPLAEETGLIVRLGEWVLGEACAQAVRWHAQGLPAVPVAVNYSARQFQFKRPAERVELALRKAGLGPEMLEVELTESAVMKDPSFAIDALRQLSELGVSISIDDFGTGHSSLAYLKRFPITKLKIDKGFIRTLRNDSRDAAITQAIIGMAHSLQMKAVAEGVETESQLDYLRTPGPGGACDEVQGYLFSPPLPAEEAGRFLGAGPPLVACPSSLP